MNIIFFGSSHFGLASLKAILDAGHNIACVVTQPDRLKGRGLNQAGTPIKEFALISGLNIFQPEKINSLESLNYLKQFTPDLFLVIAYGQILAKEILDIPKIMPVNIHGSILPHYRGAAPISWAIIKGERETGVTAIKMVEKMDAGPILGIEKTKIDSSDTFITLENKLSKMSSRLSIQTLDSIKDNKYTLTPQDENKVDFAPKLKKENGLIDWDKPAEEIRNLIRGCLGWPIAFTYYKKKLIRVFESEVLLSGSQAVSPGRITEVSNAGIIIETAKNNLLIKELQLEGKRVMSAKEFSLGHKLTAGEKLG